jgi:hypothetical protein
MESNENPKFTPRQMQVLPVLLTSPSIEEAARRSEISAKQIHEWMKDPEFYQTLKTMQHALFRDSLSCLKAGTQKAVHTLLALMDEDDPRIRLLASEKVISQTFKAVEILELEERVSKVEELIQKAQKRQ